MERANGFPHISAESWTVYDANSNKFICSENSSKQREIASLTKMMTAYTVLNLAKNFQLDIYKEIITPCLDAVLIMGTTAGLLLGDKMCIYDMLHALLLPSGNDAAVALAEYFGNLIKNKIYDHQSKLHKFGDPIKIFIKKMNDFAKNLGLIDTHFSNPHGMSESQNYSTSNDLAILAINCMKIPIFAEIVAKLKYSCLGLDAINNTKKFEWCQTNRLLWRGFNGIKTGTTDTAGICLAASYKNENCWLIFIVLGCKGFYYRWQDVVQLKDFFVKKLTKSTNKNSVSALKLSPRIHTKAIPKRKIL